MQRKTEDVNAALAMMRCGDCDWHLAGCDHPEGYNIVTGHDERPPATCPIHKEKKERSVPRDPNRIGQIIGLLSEVWYRYPDLRLGQIICNAAGNVLDPFYTEDHDVELYLQILLEEAKKNE